MEWMILPLRKYFQFSGRSRRKEYWMWTLFVFVMGFVLGFVDTMLGLGGDVAPVANEPPATAIYNALISGGILSNIFTVLTIIPGIAVSVRRLHDVDRSGWWLLSWAFPVLIVLALLFSGYGQSAAMLVISGIALLAFAILGLMIFVWDCTDGTHGPNRFGEDPKDDGIESLAETFA